MSSWGKADYEQLKALQQRLQRFQGSGLDAFCRECSKELAARLLALVIPRTPVGYYKGGSYHCITARGEELTHTSSRVEGKNGGTLRRGWTAGKNTNPSAYAGSLPIKKAGNFYSVQVLNPIEYASYVEFGHRTTRGGYAKPHYFLTVSEEELRRLAPAVLERRINAFFREVFNG